MAQKPETTFKQRVAQDLKFFEQNCTLWKTKIQQESIRGTPDYILCVKGYFIAIELKHGGNVPPEPLQLYNQRKIKACGGVHFVAHPDNWDDIFNYIVNLTKKRGAEIAPVFKD